MTSNHFIPDSSRTETCLVGSMYMSAMPPDVKPRRGQFHLEWSTRLKGPIPKALQEQVATGSNANKRQNKH